MSPRNTTSTNTNHRGSGSKGLDPHGELGGNNNSYYFSDVIYQKSTNPCPKYDNGKERRRNSNNRLQSLLLSSWIKPACCVLACVFVIMFISICTTSNDNDSISSYGSSYLIRTTLQQQQKQKQKQIPYHDILHFNVRGNYELDGPPKDFILHGSRDYYTPVPHYAQKQAWTDGKDSHLHRAFQRNGWIVSHDPKDLKEGKHHILYQRQGSNKGFTSGKPWQRYSRVPGGREFGSKHLFFEGMKQLQKQTYADAAVTTGSSNKKPRNPIFFIPETYNLDEKEGRTEFAKVLNQDKLTKNHRPWVLKKVRLNNGSGIEMIPPDSPALYSAIDRSQKDKDMEYVIQSYICNELTWFGGEKFDLRFYWMIASVDPLVVLYHDGYARVSGTLYDETNFDSTAQHLTNHAFRTGNDEDVLADALWRRVTEHYEANKSRLSKIIGVGTDPVQHVRNQLKEAISATAAAFADAFTLHGPKNRDVTTENLFALYGSDFVIDADLDVYYLEAQVSPGLGDSYDFRIDLFRSLFRPMINIVEEIATKQSQNAKANILPLETLDSWEIVYASSANQPGQTKDGTNTWRYQYHGYERSESKKGCNLSPSDSSSNGQQQKIYGGSSNSDDPENSSEGRRRRRG